MNLIKARIHLFIALAVSLPAWIYVFVYDWKVALAFFGIIWGSNITNRVNSKL